MTKTPLNVSSVDLSVNSHGVNGGEVQWILFGGNQVVLPTSKSMLYTEKLSGCKSISLRAILNGGEVSNDATNTQIFRHSQSQIDAVLNQPQMVLKVKMQDDVPTNLTLRYLFHRKSTKLLLLSPKSSFNGKLSFSQTPSLLDLTDIKLDAQSDTLSAHSAGSGGETLTLTPTEIQSKKFHLKYDVITDTYSRLSDNSSQTEEWSSFAKEHHNIKRLEDKDAKMACLARSSKHKQ